MNSDQIANNVENNSENKSIPVVIGTPRHNEHAYVTSTAQHTNLKSIRRSNRAVEALYLPTVMNINPRSAYNCPENLALLIKEHEIDAAFLSESWE